MYSSNKSSLAFLYKNILKIFIPLLVFVISFSLSQPVLAATEGLSAKQFEVFIKPEYDDPRTLVIYEAEFVNSSSEIIKKNTPISFIIPKPEKSDDLQIGMACEVNAVGGHECQPYVTKDIGDGQLELSWKITKDIKPGQKYPTFLEFYYNNQSAPPSKSFEYSFYPTSNIDFLTIFVTAPKGASNFVTIPTTNQTGKDGDGLNFYAFNYTNKTSGDPIKTKISYTKNDNKPTFDSAQVGGQSNASSNSSSESNWFSKPSVAIPTIFGVAALAFLLGFIIKKPKHSNGGSKTTPPKKSRKDHNPISKPQNADSHPSKSSELNAEKRKLRKMLLDGKISEETFKQLSAELESETNNK